MTNTGGRRLKQWLIEQIQSAQYAGLQWEDESRTLFRIPWKHAGKQDYNQEVDASIFKVWHQSQRQKITWMPGIRIYSFFHRPGLFLKASTRRGKRLNLPPGRPDFAVLWIKALTSRRWPSAHSSTFLNLTKSTASCLRKSRRVSWFHLHLHSTRWLDCPPVSIKKAPCLPLDGKSTVMAMAATASCGDIDMDCSPAELEELIKEVRWPPIDRPPPTHTQTHPLSAPWPLPLCHRVSTFRCRRTAVISRPVQSTGPTAASAVRQVPEPAGEVWCYTFPYGEL